MFPYSNLSYYEIDSYMKKFCYAGARSVEYPKTLIVPTIQISSLISLFYFEFTKSYVFTGERHNFWEFLYVDKGDIEVITDCDRYQLSQGMIIFHKPNEFHSIHANKVTAPNLIVASFDCLSPVMQQFEQKMFHLHEEERNLLALIIEEGGHAFQSPFRIPLQKRSDSLIGSEQLVQSYLEIFLIKLLRRLTSPTQQDMSHHTEIIRPDMRTTLATKNKDKPDEVYVQHVVDYMKKNIENKITLADISDVVHLSKNRLQILFKQRTGFTIMEYFSRMRIEQAKTYIREETLNFTEIAEKLAFGSVHAFSKTFKKITEMSPSEYAKSVQAKIRTNDKPSYGDMFTDHCGY